MTLSVDIQGVVDLNTLLRVRNRTKSREGPLLDSSIMPASSLSTPDLHIVFHIPFLFFPCSLPYLTLSSPFSYLLHLLRPLSLLLSIFIGIYHFLENKGVRL